ncbi:hypothetical protein FRC00_000690 [Tulasnella sp. 408]|nr:hypothetical protein FRC00_000690 [Tulasnella sp. 408]
MSSSNTPPPASSSPLVPTFTKSYFGVFCDEEDAEAIRTQYLSHEQWSSVEIVPDDTYNSQKHKKKRYIALCKSDSTLRLAYRHLRVQGVQTEHRVEGQAVKVVATKLKRLLELLGEEHTSDVVGPTARSPPSTSTTGSTNDAQNRVQVDDSSTNATLLVSSALVLPQPAPVTFTASPASHIQQPSLPSSSKPSLPPWFTQDARLTVASPTRDLPPKWSIKSQVPPVHDEDSVLTVDFAKQRYLQRREEFSRLLQKPNSELRGRQQELRDLQESMEDAKRDYEDKEDIERFLSQYSDRPIVPEYWAYDTKTFRYKWVGPSLDYNGDETDKPRPWKGYNY